MTISYLDRNPSPEDDDQETVLILHGYTACKEAMGRCARGCGSVPMGVSVDVVEHVRGCGSVPMGVSVSVFKHGVVVVMGVAVDVPVSM